MKIIHQPSRKIRSVGIDIGGPLRVSDTEMNACHREAFERHTDMLYPLGDREAWQLYGIFASEGYREFMRAALAFARGRRHLRYFLGEDNVAGAVRRFIGEYASQEDEEIIARMARESENAYNRNPSNRVQPDSMTALEILRESKISRVGIITQAYEDASFEWCEEMFPGYFSREHVIGKCDADDKDRKEEKLVLMAQRLDVEPAEMLYVADTRGDIEGSRKAGNPVVMVLNGMGFPQLWKDIPPDLEVENLEEAAKWVAGQLGRL
ncbi:MAG: HAD hydrolase-like protein [Candidatus Aenigmarchaeota archaeon]|nr:HAD hydrolase-like protein [Candidatus Aenigmarchaeota archaeon]